MQNVTPEHLYIKFVPWNCNSAEIPFSSWDSFTLGCKQCHSQRRAVESNPTTSLRPPSEYLAFSVFYKATYSGDVHREAIQASGFWRCCCWMLLLLNIAVDVATDVAGLCHWCCNVDLPNMSWCKSCTLLCYLLMTSQCPTNCAMPLHLPTINKLCWLVAQASISNATFMTRT